MLPEKIVLNNEIISIIIKERKNAKLSTITLSENIGKNQPWWSRLEHGKMVTINKNLLIKIFTIIKNLSIDEAEIFIKGLIRENEKSDINSNDIELILKSSIDSIIKLKQDITTIKMLKIDEDLQEELIKVVYKKLDNYKSTILRQIDILFK
jgi:transcriptional regulator with XRE-family HTH domain